MDGDSDIMVDDPVAEESSLTFLSIRATKQHLLVRVPPLVGAISEAILQTLEALRWLCEANRAPMADDEENNISSILQQDFSLRIDGSIALHAYSTTSHPVPAEELELGSCWAALFRPAFVVPRPVQRT